MPGGRPIGLKGYTDEEVRRAFEEIFRDEPDADEISALCSLDRRNPGMARGVRARGLKQAKALVARVHSGLQSKHKYGVRKPTSRNRYTRVRGLLISRGLADLASRFDVEKLKELITRLRLKGPGSVPDPRRTARGRHPL